MESLAYRKRIKNDSLKSEKYLFRKTKKHQNELLLVERALKHLTGCKSLLDAPCGAGRMSFLAETHGFKATGVDLGDGILKCAKSEKAKKNSQIEILKEDIEKMSFPDKAFDAALCFRFFHHLPNPEVKMKVISELTRVSSKYVVISYFSSFSITSLKRKIKILLKNPSSQNSTKFSELNDYFEKCGFQLHYHRFLMPFFKTLCIAVFKRIED